jgi:hypothetical protein
MGPDAFSFFERLGNPEKAWDLIDNEQQELLLQEPAMDLFWADSELMMLSEPRINRYLGSCCTMVHRLADSLTQQAPSSYCI